MATNRSTSRIALALIASLAFTGTALAQRGADRAAAASRQQTAQAHQMKLAAVVGSRATSADMSNSSAKEANSANPTVAWSFAPSANVYEGRGSHSALQEESGLKRG